MRYILLSVLCALTLFFTACSTSHSTDRLAYQNSTLSVEGIFTINEEEIPIKIKLSAPEYDENGRMLARDATLTLGENSIISGVCFEITDGEIYISSGALKIPIKDEAAVSGISDIISLFCISGEHYHSSESVRKNGLKCERAMYVNGDNRVFVTVDTTTMLPTDIVAELGTRIIAADISYIKAE